jgi:hypothetical protein
VAVIESGKIESEKKLTEKISAGEHRCDSLSFACLINGSTSFSGSHQLTAGGTSTIEHSLVLHMIPEPRRLESKDQLRHVFQRSGYERSSTLRKC